ncbi:hypothetical protein [Lactococcus lactis]|nr:hypothetical protein [Lactococcus lactis]
MNYYEKALLRLRRNFNFSMGIYSGRPLLQRTLCKQMMQEVDELFIPRPYPLLRVEQDRLYLEIQEIYLTLLGQKCPA